MLNLTETTVYFNMTSEFTKGEQAFAELPVASAFESWRIESKAGNSIALIVSLANLSRALKSCDKAQRAVVKLAKKAGRAFLTFDIAADGLTAVQDVPVSVQTPERLAECQEPELAEPSVKLKMPPLRSLRAVVERMRQVGDELTVTATRGGDLQLCVASDLVTVRTFYRGLALRRPDEAEAGDDDAETSACMSIRKFSNILQCHQLNAHFVLGCVVEGAAFVLYVRMRGERGAVTYYIPLILPDSDVAPAPSAASDASAAARPRKRARRPKHT